MANIFTKAVNGLTAKSHYTGTAEPMNGSIFYSIGSFFGYEQGTRNLGRYLHAYGRNPLVYMIVQKIATTTASIKRVAVDSNGDQIENSQILTLLNKPNRTQGMIEFVEEGLTYLLSTGNLFIRYVEGIGMGQELHNLNSSRMKLKIDNLGRPLEWHYTDNLGKIIAIPLDEVLHIKTSNVVDVSNSGVYFGLSPLEAAWMTVKSSDEIFGAEASIFKNRGIIGILTNETDTPMLKPEREELQKQFDEEVGGHDRYNKIKISNTKLKYIQTGMSPTDLKLLEGIMSKLRILCSVYGMPSVLFNDNETSTYNNVAEAKQSAYQEVYIPTGNKYDRELSNFLNAKMGTDEMVKIDVTSIAVLKAMTNEVAQALNNLPTAVASRFIENLTRNEAREIIGMDELESEVEGDTILGLAGRGNTNETNQ